MMPFVRRRNKIEVWKLPYKIARAIKRVLSSRVREMQIRYKREVWLRNLRKTGISIHFSIELTGSQNAEQRVHIAPAAAIERDVTFWISEDAGSDGQIVIASRAFVGRNTYIGAFQPISIGQATMIGAYCYLISGNHRFDSREMPIRDQGFVGSPIRIAENVWIGTHVVILPGVEIARGAIIGAGSIVNRNVGEYEIWAGVPAKFIKQRF